MDFSYKSDDHIHCNHIHCDHINRDDVISGVLEEDVDDLDNEATKKAKFFYHSCMDLREYKASFKG